MKYLIEHDSLCSFFECSGAIRYKTILRFAKENNFKRIYDIGCANGYQSEIFLNSNVEYIGIDEYKSDFWNKEEFKYIIDNYPFYIDTNEDDLAVSVLCLTWNCYLSEGELTLKKQCEQLKKDFKHCLLYICQEQIEFVSRYFENYKILNDNFVYFYNN